MGNYSVLILTLNEECDLPSCLASVQDCSDVVVLDSGSTDQTVEVARNAGARVFTRTFDTFAGQRNYADWNIPFRHEWVFHLDADEQFTPGLHRECLAKATAADVDGYYVAPKMLWLGQWIPHCTDFPAWQARFVRVPQFRFIDVGHGQREAEDMRMGRLNANYTHELASGGDNEWLQKHRRYAQAEAAHFLADQQEFRWRNLCASNPLARRRAFKHASHVLPCRPWARFIYQYVLRGGFRDGRAGLHYCRLLARYEAFTAAELRSQRNTHA